MTHGLETEFVTLHEFVKAARMKLNPNAWDYLIGGTESETTLRRNRQALDQIALRPRVLRDVSKTDASSTFFGKPVRLPVMLAPVGSLDTFHPNAAVEVATGASEFGVAKMVSSVTKLTMKEVRAASTGPLVFQLYVRGDDSFISDHVAAAIENNYEAFCLTVDTAVYSRRERDMAKRFAKPWRATATGQNFQAALSWKNVEKLKAEYDVPLILKGIATVEDARIAVEHGVECIYVSNHGGRQLDHGRGSMDVVSEILEAVDGKSKVIVDGGFCRGTDVAKAMALGVEAVGLGRLYCYALTAAGAPGIVRMLEILENEVKSAMGLMGVTAFDQLDKSYLHFGAPPTNTPGVHSAFPLLNLEDPGYGGR